MTTDPTTAETVNKAVSDAFEVRKTKRKLTRWRLIAIGLGLAVLIGVAADFAGPQGPRIAKLSIDGLIVEDADRDQLLRDIAEDDDIKALVVSISSPGGTAAASEDIYNGLRKVAAKKPVVSTMGTVAASGGYITALGTDYVFARQNTLTASIGVIFQVTRFNDLMETVGISVDSYTSGPLKGEPSPFGEPTPEARALMEGLIGESLAWFRGLVTERRGLSGAALDAVADGRVMMGNQALKAGLVDAIGNEYDAIRWLETERGIAKDLPVDDVTPSAEPEGLFTSASTQLAAWAGLKPIETKRLFVDGLATLWHPSLSD